jgi:dipeptidyl aminopeptidase/acylaminoacyl peptidase
VRRGDDAGVVQNLPHGRGGDTMAEPDLLAAYAPTAHFCAGTANVVLAGQQPPSVMAQRSAMKKTVTIWSDGVPMSGRLYAPDDLSANTSYPVVVSCHGWSAPLMVDMERTGYPEELVAAGFCLLIFDYRGWGESRSAIVPADPEAAFEPGSAVPGRTLTGVLAPFAWATDVIHALDFILGEPGIDPERIALLGSSVGGGVVFRVASRDPRVKCVVSQMGIQDLRGVTGAQVGPLPFWTFEQMTRLATSTARTGDIPLELPIPDPIVAALGAEPGTAMTGLVDADVLRWDPINDAEKIRVPVIIIDSGDESNWDIRQHGEEFARRMKSRGIVDVEHHAIEHATHNRSTYAQIGIAGTPESAMREIAVSWLRRHL